MHCIYLSPHFDDAALSCGGLIWEQAQAGGSASIWTVCAGQIPPGRLSPYAQKLHSRWRASRGAGERNEHESRLLLVELRRKEDIDSCSLISASYRHFNIPDCIYRYSSTSPPRREHYYASRVALFGALHPAEATLVEGLRAELAGVLPAEAELVCPLGLGKHVDHQLTRRAAERLGRELWYYADFPYTREEAAELERLKQAGWQARVFPVSPAGLEAWQEAIAAHRSQISTFWLNLDAMREEVRAYCEAFGGVVLWKPK